MPLGRNAIFILPLGVEHHVGIVSMVVHGGIELYLSAVLEGVAHSGVLAEPITKLDDG